MLLAVDAGNTNVVFAVHDGKEWRGRWRIATRADRTSDEYAVWLLALFQHAGINANDVTRCVIGTVVPAALYNLRRLCRDWFDTEPLIARAPLNWGFEIRVDQPNEVGADRLLNALASHTHYGGPLVVIYAKKVLPDKSNFRATISMLWLSLNSVMLVQNVVSGRMTAQIWEIIAVCLPFLLGGALAGNWAHRHIQDKYFSQLVYSVLLVSGGFMFS